MSDEKSGIIENSNEFKISEEDQLNFNIVDESSIDVSAGNSSDNIIDISEDVKPETPEVEVKSREPEILENPIAENKPLKYQVMNPADVLSGLDLAKSVDIDFLRARAPQFQERFRTRSMFRSEHEMRFGVLNLDEHPTIDSQYWQAIGEQNVHVSELINVSYEYKKLVAKSKILACDIAELQFELDGYLTHNRKIDEENKSDDLNNTPELVKETKKVEKIQNYVIERTKAKILEKQVELDQTEFSKTNAEKVGQERMKEIKNWDKIIDELHPNLRFGDEDFELHHAERYFKRYANRMKILPLLEPSAKESVLTHFRSSCRQPENRELAIQFANENTELAPLVALEMSRVGLDPTGIALPQGSNPQQQALTFDGRPGGGTNNPVPTTGQTGEIHDFTKLPKADANYDTLENMAASDKIAATYLARKVRKILVASPHRAKEDGMVTNMFNVQLPAAFSGEMSEPHGLSVADARNFVVKKALDEDYDYIFFIDDDTLIPKNGLVQLMHHKADIVGGFYYRKYFPLESVGMHLTEDGNPCPIEIDGKAYKLGDIIHDTLVLPSGCTLIKTEVFRNIEFPWYMTIQRANRPALTEDTYFCEKARLAGYDIITDLGVQCLHIDRAQGILFGHPEIVDVPNNVVRPQWRNYFAV